MNAASVSCRRSITDAELAPRDVVARAIHRQIAAGHKRLSGLPRGHRRRFRRAISPPSMPPAAQPGIDPARQPIPVAPAAHYHMGGIATDARGRSSLDGLVGGGRMRRHRPAWRQSPGLQFPAGRRWCSARGWPRTSRAMLSRHAATGTPPAPARLALPRAAACAARRHEPPCRTGARRSRAWASAWRDRAAGAPCRQRTALLNMLAAAQAGDGRRAGAHEIARRPLAQRLSRTPPSGRAHAS